MPYAETVTLTGDKLVLEPLAAAHHDGLVDAVRDGELWTLWYTRIPSPDGMAAEIDRRLDLATAGAMVPFTIRAREHGRAGKVLGMTTLMNLDEPNQHLEIGSTWLRRTAHGTGANAEAKLLLLAHAFDTLGCLRVELRTHRMNRHSRDAIERLGAQLDGILRRHTVLAEDHVRDTCVYSILDVEWPIVRRGLEARLDRRR